MGWSDAKEAAAASQRATDQAAAEAATNRRREAKAMRTPSTDAMWLSPVFNFAVAEFIRIMPKSKSSKETVDGPASLLPRKRYFYLKDWEATSAVVRRTSASAYVGAHVFLDGRVRTYGMGLDPDVDPRNDASAMNHVMALMAAELARNGLI